MGISGILEFFGMPEKEINKMKKEDVAKNSKSWKLDIKKERVKRQNKCKKIIGSFSSTSARQALKDTSRINPLGRSVKAIYVLRLAEI